MENYGLCVFDGCEAIKLNPTNVKGYFRRGHGYAMQHQLKNAVSDFKMVCKMEPGNKEAREKYEHSLKEFKYQQLALAIVSEDTVDKINPDEIVVESSYTGPRLESIDEVTPEWVRDMMDWQKDQKRLHKKYATMLINKATELFDQLDTLVHV